MWYRTLGFGRKMVPGWMSVPAKSDLQQCAYLDLVPVLASEGILSLLLKTLLALWKALVPVVLSDNVPQKWLPLHLHPASNPDCQYEIDRIQEFYSLSDSHDCDKLPSRGAVELNVCRREFSRSRRDPKDWIFMSVRLGSSLSPNASRGRWGGALLQTSCYFPSPKTKS